MVCTVCQRSRRFPLRFAHGCHGLHALAATLSSAGSPGVRRCRAQASEAALRAVELADLRGAHLLVRAQLAAPTGVTHSRGVLWTLIIQRYLTSYSFWCTAPAPPHSKVVDSTAGERPRPKKERVKDNIGPGGSGGEGARKTARADSGGI